MRQKPCSLYQAPCSGASIALIGIDFRSETAEKIAPPCIARLDVDNCRNLEICIQEMQIQKLSWVILQDVSYSSGDCIVYAKSLINQQNYPISIIAQQTSTTYFGAFMFKMRKIILVLWWNLPPSRSSSSHKSKRSPGETLLSWWKGIIHFASHFLVDTLFDKKS